MGSHCIYEVFRPLARIGASLGIHARCCPKREEAARRGLGIHAQACGEAVFAPGSRVGSRPPGGVVAGVAGGGSLYGGLGRSARWRRRAGWLSVRPR